MLKVMHAGGYIACQQGYGLLVHIQLQLRAGQQQVHHLQHRRGMDPANIVAALETGGW